MNDIHINSTYVLMAEGSIFASVNGICINFLILLLVYVELLNQ